MNDKQQQNEASQQRQNRQPDDPARQRPDLFEKMQQGMEGKSIEEEADAEQRYKETLTERD